MQLDSQALLEQVYLAKIEECLEWGSHFPWFNPAILTSMRAYCERFGGLTPSQKLAIDKTHQMLLSQVY